MEGKEKKETNSLLLINKGPFHHCCTATGSTDHMKGGVQTRVPITNSERHSFNLQQRYSGQEINNIGKGEKRKRRGKKKRERVGKDNVLLLLHITIPLEFSKRERMESFNPTGVHTPQVHSILCVISLLTVILQKKEKRVAVSFLGGEKEVESFCATLDVRFKKLKGTFERH